MKRQYLLLEEVVENLSCNLFSYLNRVDIFYLKQASRLFYYHISSFEVWQ